MQAGADGTPVAVRRQMVVEVIDRWRTDDRWWTSAPVARAYYQLLLEDGRAITAFRDEIDDRWWEQRYG